MEVVPEISKQQRLLRAAVQLIGRGQLASRMGVSEQLLEEWTEGRAAMPERNLSALARVLSAWAETTGGGI